MERANRDQKSTDHDCMNQKSVDQTYMEPDMEPKIGLGNQRLPEQPQKTTFHEDALFPKKPEPAFLTQVRRQYEITGGVSLIFGILFAVSFYRAGIGINVIFFTAVMVQLLITAMRRYGIPLKKGTKAYYSFALLFGLSTALTENGDIQLMNLTATLIMLNLSILHQLHEDKGWDFMQYLGRIFGMLFLGIGSIGMPFVDSGGFLKRSKAFKNDKIRNIFIGILAAVPLLFLITALLSNADLLFGDMTDQIYDFLFSADILGVILMILFGFLCCYCILCGAAAQTGREGGKPVKKADASIAATVMIPVCLIYAFFCGLQIVYLFAGGLFALPEGYTFAEYARQGFFELLAVAVINVALMLVITAFFGESRLLRFLLTFMTACTYILIASSAYRMLLYIGAYHLTFLRLFVLLCLFIIALILSGVIVSVYRKSFPLFRYSTMVIVVCYLAFSLAKPDYFIAAYLMDHQDSMSLEDAAYLTYDLSLDAAPVVLPKLEETGYWSGDINDIRDRYLQKIMARKNAGDFRDYNLSVDIAARYEKKYSE